ncbi:M23 family metallopeptidase [Modestobacter muralis]|uniref:M23 family metallopeptidase n=1 Tax=Modestobacter muralis TaxID=1608614 RepID=A0A6P0ERJ0_9ACTN|nr:M23 family metallopeptidase [Modestobacter muralis]NEK93416.1 M23 family metallopeptidase [Modestobacter muralis]NEN50183.1 M23 family metallopeptidase [Modestobacter muralis]
MPRLVLRPSPAPPCPAPGRLPRASRWLARTACGGLAAALAVTAVLGAGGGTAWADPVNPSDEQLEGAAAAQAAATAEVARITGLVADAEARLEQVQFQAEAAGTAYLAAEEARQLAEAAAQQTARDLQVAAEAVTASQTRIADFSRDTYKNGSELTSEMALLDADGPTELIQKAAILDYVGDHQVDVLGMLEDARVQQAAADAAAQDARDDKAAAEAAAEAAKAAADQQLAAQQTALTQAAEQKAQLDQQLQDAEVALLELQGARNAFQAWQAQKAAEEKARQEEEARIRAQAEEDDRRARAAAAADASTEEDAADTSTDSGAGQDDGGSGYVRPAVGRTSSCYGARWGVTHYGVDIAAPIGTPIYAAATGVVERAGPATGFGLAVYIRGDDGAITVYGHINRYFVADGERVRAGERIAEVGNRGQSTGPHVHFEVHPNGLMYGGQVDPVPWLRARGITIRGC